MNRPRRQGSTVLRNEFSPSQASIGSCSRNEDVRKVEIEVTPGQILIKKKKLFVKGKMLDVYTLNETIIFSPASPAVTLLSPTEGDLTLSLHPSFLAPSFPLFFSVLLSFSSTFIFDKTDQIAMLDVTLEPVSRRDGSLLVVNRAFLFESSCSEAMNVKDAEGPLFVEFDGEEGLDAGGLEREWMELIADELMGKQKSGEGDKEKKEDEEMSRARTGRMETMREENQDDDDFSSEHDGEMDEDIDLHPEMDLDIPDLPQADSPTSPTINPLTTPPLSPQYLSPFGLAPLEPDPLQDTPDQPGNHSNQPQPFKDDSADNGCAFDDEEREAQARAVERRNKETFHITRRHRPTQPSRLAVSHSTLPSPMLSGRTSPQLTQSFVSTLFVASPNTDVYLINPQMEDNPSALMSYRFVGRVIAWALVDDVLFPMKFGWSVLKKLMNKALTMADVAHDDPDFYQERIRFLLDTDLSTLDPSLFNLTFSDDEMCRVNGEVTFRTFDLVKNGREIAVTEANKLDFVHLLCSHRLWNRVKRCLFAMRKGVRDVLGKRSLGFLTAGELSYFLSGEQEIEVEELVESIRVSGKKSKEENKKVLGWTALYLRSAKNDLLKNFVRFITGSSNVHPTGFKHYSPPISLYVNLHLPKDALPVAHTCFHQLDVPLYPCYQVFQNKLTTAIQEASSGFFLV
ncbi:putative E3 ubiquitin-protein ligase UPL1 [Blattamonas nauphoetae]|uniref:HECT-type E3 ubiquitin transferase n=1 Tax=Blattamonas nauphoetae TaxID=2049346 RepID=A0ABQ9WVN0_9EUKA|nr:putative E3 ubiquitin-protein ligase UPL1 [Blattamonas nauphoetae]